MLAEMNTMGLEIMKLLKEEGTKIRDNHLVVPEDSNELRADFIRPAYKWIAEIYQNEYAKARRVKGLLSDELWKRYREWGGYEDHREMVLLRKACNALRASLVSQKRPDFYKRTKYEKAKAKINPGKTSKVRT